MSVLFTECPKCGAVMQSVNGQFVCPECRTSVLQIADAKIDGDVVRMGAEEFAKKINESKRQFVINIGVPDMRSAHLKMSDIKKIKAAQKKLDEGSRDSYKDVINILHGMPDTILSVARLRLLAEFNVKNEAELLSHEGRIDNSLHYKNIIKSADSQTKKTYEKLAELCVVRGQIEKEAQKADDLWEAGELSESESYAMTMCRKYPQFAKPWIKLLEIKQRTDSTYTGDSVHRKIIECLDYRESLILSEMCSRIDKLWNDNNRQAASEYAQAMCRIYPHKAISWANLFDIKKRTDPSYAGDSEYEKLIACPDYDGRAKEWQTRFDDCKKDIGRYAEEKTKLLPVLLSILAITGMALFIVLTHCAYAGMFPHESMGVKWNWNSAFYFGGPLFALLLLAYVVLNFYYLISRYKNKLNSKSEFYSHLNNIPEAAQEELVKSLKIHRRSEVLNFVCIAVLIIYFALSIVASCFSLKFIFNPEIGGVSYSYDSYDGGYYVTGVDTTEELLVLPEKILFYDVRAILSDESNPAETEITNYTVKELVLPYMPAQLTRSLHGFKALKSIYIMAERPYPNEYELWTYCLENNYYCDADIYWEGEWEMRDGKPVVISR